MIILFHKGPFDSRFVDFQSTLCIQLCFVVDKWDEKGLAKRTKLYY